MTVCNKQLLYAGVSVLNTQFKVDDMEKMGLVVGLNNFKNKNDVYYIIIIIDIAQGFPPSIPPSASPSAV